MKQSEVADLLEVASIFDGRISADERVIDRWHWLLTAELGEDLRAVDVEWAIRKHYGSSPDRLMPAHIISWIKELREARRDRTPLPPLPDGLEPSIEVTPGRWTPNPEWLDWVKRTQRAIDNDDWWPA